MSWVGEWDQIWTDSGSLRRLHKLTSDLTQQHCKPPWDMMWYVRYINTHSFIHSFLHTYKCQSPRGNTSEKECFWKPKRFRYNVSLPVDSVGGRCRAQLQLGCRWKRIKFCGRRITQVKEKHKWASTVLAPELYVDADCWFLWRYVDPAAAKQMKLSPSSPKILIFQVVW